MCYYTEFTIEFVIHLTFSGVIRSVTVGGFLFFFAPNESATRRVEEGELDRRQVEKKSETFWRGGFGREMNPAGETPAER